MLSDRERRAFDDIVANLGTVGRHSLGRQSLGQDLKVGFVTLVIVVGFVMTTMLAASLGVATLSLAATPAGVAAVLVSLSALVLLLARARRRRAA